MSASGSLSSQLRGEAIFSGKAETVLLSEGVQLREFARASCGARGFSTGIVTFVPGASLAYHTHPVSEAIIVVTGTARVAVEGRRYLLNPLDCLHVPAGTAHEVTNVDTSAELVAFSAFATDSVTRNPVQDSFEVQERGALNPGSADPENIVRFSEAAVYELSQGAMFVDLFAARFGSVGICGGYGRFAPGSSLPCHIHLFDESISIIEGEANCLVQGNRYVLSNCDTALIPEGRPHRFLNLSNGHMAMIWVYAGSEPERTLVSAEYCDGTWAWDPSQAAKTLSS